MKILDTDLMFSVRLQCERRTSTSGENLLKILPGETVHSVLRGPTLSDSLPQTNELASHLNLLDVTQSIPPFLLQN